MSTLLAEFLNKGWLKFPRDQTILDWVRVASPFAETAITDPANAAWVRAGGSWFVGVHALPNAPDGRVENGPALAGRVIDFLNDNSLCPKTWDRAQVSVMYPGYPRRDPAESDASFAFRKDRCAAHVDGLLPVGPDRRRYLKEPHAFVLGLAMDDTRACPMVVWEGSHEIMRRTFQSALGGHPAHDWCDVDVTEAYAAARREVFEQCQKIELFAKPGEAYVVHRLALHGVAPWDEHITDQRRAILYFRPECAGGAEEWLLKP